MEHLQWQTVKKGYEAWLSLEFLPPDSTFVYRNSNNMTLIEPSSAICTPCGFHSDMQSHDVVIVGNVRTEDYVLAGAVTAFRSLTYFTVRKRGRINGIVVHQPHIKENETPEKIVILRGNDWRKLLLDYARMAAEEMGYKPVDPDKNITGYCTWYYYYAGVTEKDFLENVDALKKCVGSAYSPQVIQIDDGYQTFQGDWLDQDSSWPTPLRDIAAKITESGITAGIWLMPFVCSTASRTFREHPEWFVKNQDGKPLVFAGWSPAPDHLWACIDSTVKEVRDHITFVMQEFRRMGFSYFKMDGLAFGLPDGIFSDPDATPVSAFRLLMKTIREAVPDSTLLGCTPPFMACLGFVDMCRVSNDTARSWIGSKPDEDYPPDSDTADVGIQAAWHGTVANWWKIDTWFRADPDVIMARSDNAFYTAGEARISAAAGILTGVSLTSDHLGRITPDRLALLECAAKYRLKDPVPAKWMVNRWPCAFSGTADGKKAVLFVNDSEQKMHFAFSAFGLPGECSEKLIGLGRVTGEIVLPAHDAAFVIAE